MYGDDFLQFFTGLSMLGVMAKKLPADILAYFVRKGREGGLIGGKARAKALTPARRKEIARAAIKARWAKKH
jgi:hypothetical protein